MQLDKILYREHMRTLAQETQTREIGRAIFTEIRDTYAANLCGYIRVYAEAERRGRPTLPAPYRSRDWCNAAVHILTTADEITQDFFIRSDEKTKDRMVEAVLEDGGIVNLAGFFAELPPL